MAGRTLRLQQETAAKDAALEIMYQDQYTERLRKQEEAGLLLELNATP